MNFSRSKKRNNIEVNLIPLINVIFLLLIFFITVGKIDSNRDLSVNVPKSSLKQEKADKISQITIMSDNKIYLGNQILTNDIIKYQIKDFIEKNPNVEITIKADKKARAKTLSRLIKIINRFGGEAISLVVTS